MVLKTIAFIFINEVVLLNKVSSLLKKFLSLTRLLFVSVYADDSIIKNKPLKGISTSDLVILVYQFCLILTGVSLYPYQEQYAKRVIRSVLTNDGAEITALFARQSGKSEAISVVVAGMLVILPTLSNMPMFANDARLKMFKEGLWVGIFAPGQRQAQITFNRIKKRLIGKSAKDVLTSPEFGLSFTTANGQTVSLTNGSFVTSISASDQSNIEGESFMLLIMEECLVKGTKILTQYGEKPIEEIKEGETVLTYNHENKEVESKTVLRSFSQPLFNRKIVTVKVSNDREFTCTDNHKIYVQNKGYVRADNLQLGDLILSYAQNTQEDVDTYDTVNARNANRRRFFSLSRQKIFSLSPICNKSFIQTIKVCMAQVRENKRIMFARTKNHSQQWKGCFFMSGCNKMFARIKRLLPTMLSSRKENNYRGLVKSNERRSPCLLVYGRWFFLRNDEHTHSGIFNTRERINKQMVIQTLRNNIRNTFRQTLEQALFVFQRSGQKFISMFDRAFCPRMHEIQIAHNTTGNAMCSVWGNDCTIQSKENCSVSEVQRRVSKRKNEGILLSEQVTEIEIKQVDEIEVYDLTVSDNHNFFAEGVLVHNCQDISNSKIRKGIHPMGAAYNATKCKIGTATTFRADFYYAIQRNKKEYEEKKAKGYTRVVRNHFEYDCEVAAKYNPWYRKYIANEKRILGENSDEYQMSYKLQWLLSRGMFIELQEFFVKCGEFEMERVLSDRQATHVAGIDIGGSSKGSDPDSTVITIAEVDWSKPVMLESRTDLETGEDIVYIGYNAYIKDWCEIQNPDYEQQYSEIVSYLNKFKIKRCVCDATRETSIAHRLRANMPFEVIPFVFGTKSKSELYKHLSKEINAERVRVPMGEFTIQTKEFERFTTQLEDLQKDYSGQHLVVSHPVGKGHHDDYPDSLALAVWGCSFEGETNDTETRNTNEVFKENNNRNKVKNKFTAKRKRKVS